MKTVLHEDVPAREKRTDGVICSVFFHWISPASWQIFALL